MKRIRIHCPSCNQVGQISVSDEILKDTLRGLIAINIAENIICSHSFIAYVDKNLAVRDYFIADFKIELPEIPLPKIEGKPIPNKDVLNLDLIKLNLSAILIVYIIKSIFSRKRIAILSEESFLNNHIINFFEFITKGTFDIDVSIISKKDYRKKKNQFKDYVVFANNKIIQNNNLVNFKEIKVEKQIVHSFLANPDLPYSYIVLKNEIYKAYILSKDVVDYIKTLPEDQQSNLSNLKILDNIIIYANEKKIKLSKFYMEFITEIIVNYFKIKLSKETLTKDFISLLGKR